MKLKYLLFFVLVFMLGIFQVNADCSDSELSRLNSLASNVKLSYEYRSSSKSFDLIVSGLSKEIYVFESKNSAMAIIYDFIDNEGLVRLESYFNSGAYRFIVASANSSCARQLRTITLTVPKYNEYSNKEECKGIDTKKFVLCDEWYQGNITEEYFEKRLEQYNKSGIPTTEENIESNSESNEETKTEVVDKILDFLKDYYLFITTGTALIVGLVIYIIIRKKKGALD